MIGTLVVKELSDCKWTRAHNYIVPTQTLSHLTKPEKGFSRAVNTYPYSVIDCECLPCRIRVLTL